MSARIRREWIAPRPVVPQAVLDEHDHRSRLQPRDLTAAFFGDPLPGYSALDQRGESSTPARPVRVFVHPGDYKFWKRRRELGRQRQLG